MAFTEEAFFKCCGSRQFARKMAALQLHSLHDLITATRRVWFEEVGVAGWLEAFGAHPRIGDVASLREKFARCFDCSQR